MDVRNKESTPQQVGPEKLGMHDHPCLLYENNGQLADAFVPYLRAGLALGEQCVYFIDENPEEFVVNSMQTDGFDLKPFLNSGAFKIISAKDAHLKDNHFAEKKMMSYWENTVAEAVHFGFTGVRAAVEMTWALPGHPGCEILASYESKLNNFTAKSKLTVVCQYHRRKFKPELLKNIIHAHPIVISDSEVLQNVNFIRPDRFLEGDADLDIKVMLDNLALSHHLSESNKALHKANQALQHAIGAEKLLREELQHLEDERRRREIAEARAQQYRFIAEAIPQIVWTADANGQVDFLNGRWYQLTECYPENSLGSGWFQEIHPDERHSFVGNWKDSTSSAMLFEIPARLRLANNDYRWILFRAVPIRDGENKVIKWFGTGTDIHAQKTLEIQLQSELQAERAGRTVV